MSRDAYRQALAQLLPVGFAWPRDTGSVWMRVIDGMAGSFDELEAITDQVVQEWLPHATRTRLEEWEAATSLPDACFGADQSYADRQARLVARLRGLKGDYSDSSPAAKTAIQALCASMGYSAEVFYNTRFRVGRDRCGRHLGRNTGVLNVRITASQVVFRAGRQRCGDRLIKRPPQVEILMCALQAYIPARFSLQMILVSI